MEWKQKRSVLVISVVSSLVPWTYGSTFWRSWALVLTVQFIPQCDARNMCVSVSPPVKQVQQKPSPMAQTNSLILMRHLDVTVVNRGRQGWWSEHGYYLHTVRGSKAVAISRTVRITMTAFPEYQQSLVQSSHKARRLSWACIHQRAGWRLYGHWWMQLFPSKRLLSWCGYVRCDNIRLGYCYY